MTISNIALTVGAIAVLCLLWAMQRSGHAFDIRDALMDSATGKASLNAIILFGMALLSAWVVVDRENDGKDDVGSILLGVLGIFVTGRVLAQGVSAFKPTDEAKRVTDTTTVTSTTEVVKPPPTGYQG